MLELLLLALLGTIAYDHHNRMKALGQKARENGKPAEKRSQ